MSIHRIGHGWAVLGALLLATVAGHAQETRFGLGIRMGAARIEGDLKSETLRPFGSGLVFYSPDPHLSLGLEAGWGDLLTDDDAQQDSVVRVVPFEADLTLRFSPYARFSPFVSLGGGGMVWHNFRKQDKQTLHYDEGRSYTTFVLKTAGGVEFSLSRRLNLSLGAAFRHALTDKLDLNPSGDEDDGLITVFTGLTFKLGSGPPDRDRDGVLDRYDLDSRAAEDRDGYMDHDGVPDTQIGTSLLAFTSAPAASGVDDIPPIVIHNPVRRATAGRDLRLRAEIFENRKLLKAAVLYRPYTTRRWLVEPMVSNDGEKYEAHLPGAMISRVGLEYCVVAVDEAISGLGYSGLPNRPNFVMVNRSETWWRVAGVVAAAGGWGAASYLVARHQKN